MTREQIEQRIAELEQELFDLRQMLETKTTKDQTKTYVLSAKDAKRVIVRFPSVMRIGVK